MSRGELILGVTLWDFKNSLLNIYLKDKSSEMAGEKKGGGGHLRKHHH